MIGPYLGSVCREADGRKIEALRSNSYSIDKRRKSPFKWICRKFQAFVILEAIQKRSLRVEAGSVAGFR